MDLYATRSLFRDLQHHWLGTGLKCPQHEGTEVHANPVLGIPFSPLYGTGALLLILLEPWMPTDLALKFFVCGMVLTALEFVMGEMSLIVFKKRYWDYTHHLFDLQGHTSARLFIAWSALGLFLLEVLHPWVQTSI